MVSKKGVKKPRTSEYGKAHAVRFKKATEQKLAVYCITKGVRLSSVIQEAVEQFLRKG